MTVAPRASIAFNAASALKPGCGNPKISHEKLERPWKSGSSEGHLKVIRAQERLGPYPFHI